MQSFVAQLEPSNVQVGVIKWNPPISTICVGSNYEIGVDKKFNWFQKKMLKWCFGFEVKENKDETKRTETTAD